MKDKLSRKFMTKCVRVRTKLYNYLIDDHSEDKKAKEIKVFVMKRKVKFENYKNCLEATQLDSKIRYLEKIKLIQIFIKKS